MATINNAKKFIEFFNDDDIIREMLESNYETYDIEEDDIEFDVSELSTDVESEEESEEEISEIDEKVFEDMEIEELEELEGIIKQSI